MIYSYGARNYYSFREGMDVSFKLSNKVPSNFSQGRKAATVLGIKGANASGKTNILKCLEFLAQFITESFGFDEGEYIGFDSYFDNESPSDFYIDFELSGVRYFYELCATPNEVVSEVLYRKLQRKTLVFERKGLSIVDRPSELSAIDLVELKSNASVISTVVKYKIKELHDIFLPIYEYFDNITGNVARTSVVPDERMFKQGSASSFYYKTPDAFAFAKEIIKKSDLGITDIVIHKNELAAGKTEYFPLFLHKVGNTGLTHYLSAYQQSSGTMALFRRLAMYWVVLTDGGVLVMDEFDQNCHPMLLPLLLELFTDKKINRQNAQFIFTAHNSDIIDDLGKYRTILVSKKDGESYCYRLDDIPGDLIRNDRSIAALYREGKIGGVPIL
ncbi:ATP-binding protein [Pseudomonas sp. CCUG 57209]|uniref:AAA family ATPase n=1 Tax=Pseudomonas sivasensis TaxID=1880678 RepID=UPI0015EB34DF|nr:ATP-binding protein [Pseudomonas sivasensis]MBA2927101.1 ATP-binding protein [Pseudomonas sivasensis]